MHITEFGPDGSPLYNNQAALDYHGLTVNEWKSADLHSLLHPQDAATDEDDGYIMSYVYNGERNSSEVVILSAQDFTGQPLAVVELPVRVPFGFHGNWIPDRP